MATHIRYALVCILRSPGILLWTLAFPLILSTIFSFMFSGIEEMTEERAVTVAVVADERYQSSDQFRAFLGEVSEEEDGALRVIESDNEEAARKLVDSGEAAAYVTLDADGTPRMTITSYSEQRSAIDRSILRAVLDRYLQASSTAQTLAQASAAGEGSIDPPLLQEALTGGAAPTEDASVLRVEPDGYSRYYYALLGMASLMGAGIALNAVSSVRANCSNLGARRQISAASPTRQLASTLVASWLASFACLLVAFAFMRFALNVEFGGRDGLAVAALAGCSLLATGAGSLIGAIPRLSLGAKNGINTAFACVLSIGTGLYGEPAMELADWLDSNAPLVQTINPAAQVSSVFYDLAYYTSLEPFAGALALLCATAAVLFGAAGLLMRRQSYARL